LPVHRTLPADCSTPTHRCASTLPFFMHAEAPLAAPCNGSMRTTMMRHSCKVAKLGRPADQRKALIRGLVGLYVSARVHKVQQC